MDVNNTSWVQARAAFALDYSGGHGYVAAPTSNPATHADHTTSTSNATDQLVAGAVRQTPHFEAAQSRRSYTQGPLQLYTRPADRNEAAVGVALGQKVDIRV